jgi:hypothetical protein
MLQQSSRTTARLLRQPISLRCTQRQLHRISSPGPTPSILLLRNHAQPPLHPQQRPQPPSASHQAHTRTFTTTPRHNATPPSADALIEQLTDLYGTARDEFEIAAEETEKKTVYAADDRDAAREAFAELKSRYEEALRVAGGDVGREVKERVGQRVRELENALVALEESAMED